MHTIWRRSFCENVLPGFSQKGSHQMHIMAIHLKEKPHECEMCQNRSSQKGIFYPFGTKNRSNAYSIDNIQLYFRRLCRVKAIFRAMFQVFYLVRPFFRAFRVHCSHLSIILQMAWKRPFIGRIALAIFFALLLARAQHLAWYGIGTWSNMNFFALTWYIILPVHSIRILHILTHTPVLWIASQPIFSTGNWVSRKKKEKIISQPRVLKRLPLAFGVVDGEVNGLRSKLFWQF